MTGCRVCGAEVSRFIDLGTQPISNAFRDPADSSPEFTYQLRVGTCSECAMIQLAEDVPRERMFHGDYPFRTSTSARMRAHFAEYARRLLDQELTGEEPFVVEIGCNDGSMLRSIAAAGVRHLGVDPAEAAVQEARRHGVCAEVAFFEESSAVAIADGHGRADVVYAANTLGHIPYLDSIFRGLDRLLKPDGAFVFEDPYLGDVIELGSFDQIYDEHFYLFSATSIARAARRFGFELVGVERLGVHGGEIRYTVASSGSRRGSPAVAELLNEESDRALHSSDTLRAFARTVARRRDALVSLLDQLRRDGRKIAGYGATAKSATVLNYCGVTADLLPRIYDITPAKQGKLAPGSRIPVLPFPESAGDYPDYFLLFAWNHADEIAAKETAFREAGGRWIRYVPDVQVV
jgi:methylation protein EvaC